MIITSDHTGRQNVTVVVVVVVVYYCHEFQITRFVRVFTVKDMFKTKTSVQKIDYVQVKLDHIK